MTDFSAWNHKASYSQPGCSDGDKTNYRVYITIPYQSFINADFSDIRFALADGTILTYALKSYTASSTATFLVIIPSLPASPSSTTVIVYAGNSSAISAASDISDVETDNWKGGTLNGWTIYKQYGGNTVVENVSWDNFGYNVLHQPCVLNYGRQVTGKAQTSLVGDFEFTFQFKASSNEYIYFQPFTNGTVYTADCYKVYLESGSIKLQKTISNTTTTLGTSTYTTDTSPHTIRLTRDASGNMAVYYDGVQVITATDNSLTTSTNILLIAGTNTATTDAIWAYGNVLPNPPSTGTLGSWQANSGLTITVPPVEGTLSATAPIFVLGGSLVISVPPAQGVLTANPPSLRAIISSPPAKGTLTAIPPIIAFLMEVKAGVTYNPDAINDLKEDGIPCNISFNVTIGDQQYE